MHTRLLMRLVLALLIIVTAVAFLGCESSDPIAPEGSTITVTASPDPIDLTLGNTSLITARVISGTGVPAPDGTAVFFDPSGGTLSVTTTETSGGAGEATTVLTVQAAGSVTVKAFSGSISGSRNVNAIAGAVGSVTLDSGDPVIRLQCTDTVDLFGTVLTTGGDPIPNQTPSFSVVSSSPSGLRINVNTSPTDNAGDYSATLVMVLTDCEDKCDSGVSCTMTIKSTVLNRDSAQNLIISETVP